MCKAVKQPDKESKDPWVLGLLCKDTVHGYLFWTGPNTDTYSEWLTDAHTLDALSIIAQRDLLMSLAMRNDSSKAHKHLHCIVNREP
jgi:hypothetical protein